MSFARLLRLIVIVSVVLAALPATAQRREHESLAKPQIRSRSLPLDEAGTNVRCNQDAPGNQQREFSVATCPTNMNYMLVGAMNAFGDVWCDTIAMEFYTSTNGGASFTTSLVTRGPAGRFRGACDPVAVIDTSGRMYTAYLAHDGTGVYNNGIYVQTSTNSGSSWSSPVAVAEHFTGQEFVMGEDKPYACCDFSAGSPYLNNYYIMWTRTVSGVDGSAIYFSRSTDGGASFSTPLRASDPCNGYHYAIRVCPTVGPDGTLYAVWEDDDVNAGTSTIRFDRSTDAGATWGQDITISDFVGQNSSCTQFNPSPPPYPVLACDISNSLRRGWLYVSWVDGRNERADILFSRSTDGGSTWSEAHQIDDGPSGSEQWYHWMVCHPQTGDLGLSWIDFRGTETCQYRTRATVSSDGGTSWLASFPVADVVSVMSSSTNYLGDYFCASFAEGGFITVWNDLRNDSGDCYAATFRCTPTNSVTLNSPPDLHDIERNVAHTYSWDPGTQPSGTTYDIEWDDDSTFASPIGQHDLSATSVTQALTGCYQQTFYWRVRSGNACGNGSWSSPTRRVVMSTPLAAPDSLTAYFNSDTLWLRFHAPEAGTYHVLSTTDSLGSDIPLQYWSQESSLVVSAGTIVWPSPHPAASYKRYTIIQTCNSSESARSNEVAYIRIHCSGEPGHTGFTAFGLPFKFWDISSGNVPSFGSESRKPSAIVGSQLRCDYTDTADRIIRQGNEKFAFRNTASGCSWSGALETDEAEMEPGRAYWLRNSSGADCTLVLAGDADTSGIGVPTVTITAPTGSETSVATPYSWRNPWCLAPADLDLRSQGFTGGLGATSDKVVNQASGRFFYFRTSDSTWQGSLSEVCPGQAYWIFNRHLDHTWTYTFEASAKLSLPHLNPELKNNR